MTEKKSLSVFYSAAVDLGVYTKANRLRFYLEQYLFKGIDFKNKRVIDIGGGDGLFGFYAAIKGASHVVVMEPEFDGSSEGMNNDFRELKQALGNPNNIELVTSVLEDYESEKDVFDVVLLHNSINHIDEQGCIHLLESKEAQSTYEEFFGLLSSFAKQDSILIICDCTNKNIFYSMKMTNPIMKTIEWEKHQSPTVWAKMASKYGYQHISTKWTTLNALGRFGRIVFGNKLMSFLTLSHFRLELKKTTN